MYKFSRIIVMKIGFIGERYNYISFSILSESLRCSDVTIKWFVDSRISTLLKNKLYPAPFKYPLIVRLLLNARGLYIKAKMIGPKLDCKKLCIAENISYIVPRNFSINTGLPNDMYLKPDVDYVIIAGCDQILKGGGLKLANKGMINYHYSPLPSYRGKFVVFWQWYNREPFIGYTFHYIDEGVDTGKIVYQNKIYYNPNEPLNLVSERVIRESAKKMSEVFLCLKEERSVILDDRLIPSYYPAQKYIDLITVDSARALDEVISLYEKLGFFRLTNGLIIKKILYKSNQKVTSYKLTSKGIIVPLKDGHIHAEIPGRLAFILKCLGMSNRLVKDLR